MHWKWKKGFKEKNFESFGFKNDKNLIFDTKLRLNLLWMLKIATNSLKILVNMSFNLANVIKLVSFFDIRRQNSNKAQSERFIAFLLSNSEMLNMFMATVSEITDKRHDKWWERNFTIILLIERMFWGYRAEREEKCEIILRSSSLWFPHKS